MGEIIAVLTFLAAVYFIRPKFIAYNRTLNNVYTAGAAFRVVGTIVYLVYAINFSGGFVDAFAYSNYAREFANHFREFDFSPFTNKEFWRNGQLFYTNFVSYPTAFFLIYTLDSTFGVYLLFSLVCFSGLVLILHSFAQNYPQLEIHKVSLLLFMFPALWFWTSTIGKDAFIFLGIGLVCYGITDSKLNFIKIACGLAIIYAFRPPTAYITISALAAFFVFNTRDSVFFRISKIVVGLLVLFYLFNFLANKWGIEEFSSESLEEFQSSVLRKNNYGSGALEQKSGGLSSIPRGVVDVLAKPFLWEAKSPLTLASALEINFVLFLIVINWSSFMRFIRNSLRHRLSTFVLAFLVIYVLSVGLFENNIGLIARHRSIIFPFMFLMIYGYYNPARHYPGVKKQQPL